MDQQKKSEQQVSFQHLFPITTMNSYFSILTWNCLANQYSDGGEKGFSKSEPSILVWDYRKKLIEDRIKQFNADIICLEEIDMIDFYKQFLEPLNYSVTYLPKNSGEGMLVAVNTKKFEIVKISGESFLDDENNNKPFSQSFLYTHLKNKESNKNILIFSTHMKAKPAFENVRVIQIKYIIKFINQLIQQDPQIANYSKVFCGDFNTDPHSESLKLLRQQTPGGITKCAFDDSPYSTYKIRESGAVQRKIDYMFYTESSLEVVARAELPRSFEGNNNGFPNYQQPSDHLPLYCIFKQN